MKTSFVSSSAIANTLRLSTRQAEASLVGAERELATGRWSDIGLKLGARTGLSVNLRQQHAQLGVIRQTNDLVTSRLAASQATLGGLIDGANGLIEGLIAGRSAGQTGVRVVQDLATDRLDGLIASLNTSFGGNRLFAGISTETEPLTDYFGTPPPASKQSVDAAFLAAFGVDQDDPAVGAITQAEMQTFLDGDFTALFELPSWQADWSSASSEPLRNRISVAESLDTSATANELPIRQLAEAYTMVADLGASGLPPETFAVLADKALGLIAEAVGGVASITGRLGAAEQRIAQANERMTLQIDMLELRVTGMEGVDPYEASTRVTQYMTQVETAYALTARMQRLGLLNYL